MKHLYRFLNLFPQLMSSTRLHHNWVYGLVGLTLLASLSIMATMTGDIEPKVAFLIDGVHLPTASALTVGEGSALSYPGVPKDYLTLERKGNDIEWHIDSLTHCDTLMYFKIDNTNPQKHAILDSDQQHIIVTLDGSTFSCTGADIWNEWQSFAKQKDILLRHFATRYQRCHPKNEEGVMGASWINDERLHSFFEHDNDNIVLVILDRHTQIADPGKSPEGYCYSGLLKKTDRCKVQFFRVSTYCYLEDGAEEDGQTFRIDSVNYVMKPTVMLTGWGAGHVMVDYSGKGTHLRFQKPLGYVGTIDSLRNARVSGSHHITLKQQGMAFPSHKDIYLPQVSTAIPSDFCSFEFGNSNDVQLRDNNDNISPVQSLSARTKLPWLPTLTPVTLHSGSATLDCRVGIIDAGFALSYWLLPLMVLVALLVLVLGPLSPVRQPESINDSGTDGFALPAQLVHYPVYLALLLLVAFCYACCKSLVALKLSYTYPYFEKLTGITPVTTALFILLVFTIAMIINTRVIGTHERPEDDLYDDSNAHPKRKWGAFALVSLLYSGLVWAFHQRLDVEVSGGVLAAYHSEEVFSPYFWNWPNIFGINDLHRSVPFAQMFVEGALLFVWLVQNMCWQWRALRVKLNKGWTWFNNKVFDCWHTLTQWVYKVMLAVNDQLGKPVDRWIVPNYRRVVELSWVSFMTRIASRYSVFGVLMAGIMLALALLLPMLRLPLIILALILLLLCLWESFCLTLRQLWPSHVLLLVLLSVGGRTLGNFGTAFISLGLVLGLCYALTNVTFVRHRHLSPMSWSEEDDNRHAVFFEMLLTSIIYIVCAMVADNGYMTNYLGILMAVVGFYYAYDRNTTLLSNDPENNERESRWTHWMSLFVLLFAVSLPYLCSQLFDPMQVDYGRTSRRVSMFADFGRQQSSGFRYAESDSEFMAIMNHYMQPGAQPHQCVDPLCNEGHFLHPSVSTGQSPVVLNDLSAPAAFFGAYGVGRATAVFFLLLLALLILVVHYSFSYLSSDAFDDDYLSYAMQWRLLALLMWLGTSFYIYVSYLGYLPFTGRLLPGMGVDSVGEALESALLLAFMASVTLKLRDKTDPTPD